MNQELRERLSVLSNDQIQTIVDSFAYATVLIAGADGEIDSNELKWGSKLSHIRSYNDEYRLNDLFEEVEKSFQEKVSGIMKQVPGTVEDRYEWIKPNLSKLNEVLEQLDNTNAFSIYKSLLSFAKHIAKADGGFLGFGTISSEEHKLISLPMINEIIKEEEV
tara:strand:+ start:414 stop:902 length:489 start_codon:yes stop_codon:yes gene_type:complete